MFTITTEKQLSECGELDVRLIHQERRGATGNLEVCFGSRWSRACNTLFRTEDLNVACQSLGFTAYKNSTIFHHRSVPATIVASGPPFLWMLNCSGAESHLSECDGMEGPTEPSFVCADLRVECLGEQG